MSLPDSRLHLVDTSAEVVAALRRHFAPFADVTVEHGDLLDVAHHAAVSPANSYGFMDGGIDAAYTRFFGTGVAVRVRDAIIAQPEGFLPVGAAIAVPTCHSRIRFLIVAPTMAMPETVPASHAYRSLRAALRLLTTDAALRGDIFCPGLCTLVGGVEPDDAALEMAQAYRDALSAGAASPRA